MIESLAITKDKPITITVLRKGEQKSFTLQPVLLEKRYRIGIGTEQMKVKTLPFAAALNLSLHKNRRECVADSGTGAKDGAAARSLRSIEGPIRSARPPAKPPAAKAGLR